MNVYKIALSFSNNARGLAMNSFTWAYDFGSSVLDDSVVLSTSTTWINLIFNSLRPRMDSGYVLTSAVVSEISPVTGELIRIIGGITPTCSGTAATEMLPCVDAASAFCRTQVPRVRGSKRFGGVIEGDQADGLFNNTLVTALATAVAYWLAGPSAGFPGYSSGVWSSRVSNYVPFANSAVVTNIPGTQVSRKPGRGA